MQFDATYEPIVAGHLLFIASSVDNSVTAYETTTGKEVWHSFADGPIRFAPLAWKDKLYFASDDGYLYCLRSKDGAPLWRFRGAPSERRVLGNQRLISAWPVRGAPVISDGKIYFAAGIWPFMGIFLHALDAETGSVIWTNDGDSSIYIKQPHNADSFAGVAPQGPLVAIGQRLLVPGGRSVPACYDRDTGTLLYYALAENAKKGGGASVVATEQFLSNGGAAFDLSNEKYLGAIGEPLAVAGGMLFDNLGTELRAIDLAESKWITETTTDRKGNKSENKKWLFAEQGRVEAEKLTTLIAAGSRLFAGRDGQVFAYQLPLPKGGTLAPVWSMPIQGTPVSLVAADERLFVTTREGSIYCFGQDRVETPTDYALTPPAAIADDAAAERASTILRTTGIREGYAVVWGLGSGGLVGELARQSSLRFVVVEPEADQVQAFRERLRNAGMGSERITVVHASPVDALLPPYLANLIVAESLPSDESVRSQWISNSFACLRPYGGVACLPVPGDQLEDLKNQAESGSLVGAEWRAAGPDCLLVRNGPLPGSADWTHEHADAANTRVSKDTLVKAPLGLLWFGGPSNESILPRHGHGPQPQVCEGRLFIEGVDMLRAVDIYTGRVLWESKLPGFGKFFDNTAHQPGANASGTNYIATPQGIYVAYGESCWRLDPATGEKASEFRLPPFAGNGATTSRWGYLNVVGDYLVGGADPVFDAGLRGSRGEDDNLSASRHLAVLHRHTGEVLWTATAENGFRHNAICAGGGRLYCIDRQSGPELARLKRRGEKPVDRRKLIALDLQTGKVLWSRDQDVFGTWLSYSAERDVLVEAGRVARDTVGDEAPGMRAYQARDGEELWSNKKYAGPAMIHHDSILMAGTACELLTGKLRMREHPLSGELVEWTWSRNYGCNTPMASEHLLTFRSGAAGFFDFCNDGGTGNFGGFRSGCSNNLIVAGGILNAPDYTRTCTCSYQNQTSLALVPMPEVEIWTSFAAKAPKKVVRQVGINLGAPGDRKADDETLWLDYPSVGGDSPDIPVKIEPASPTWFRRHSSQVAEVGSGVAWVAASGAKGLTSLQIRLAERSGPIRPYTVRLHFLEPDEVAVGERVFDVVLQGKVAVSALDVIKEAGGRNRSLVKEVAHVDVDQDLVIELVPGKETPERGTLLSGVEVQAEGW
jgi:outer membrane protein assembly factor BamB